MAKRVCKWCGKTFYAANRKLYCSQECRSAAVEQASVKTAYCDVCGKEFHSVHGAVYCSDECRKVGKARAAAWLKNYRKKDTGCKAYEDGRRKYARNPCACAGCFGRGNVLWTVCSRSDVKKTGGARMKTISYIDTKRAAAAVLRAWRDMEWKLEEAGESLATISDRLYSLPGMNTTTPVQGGGNAREASLCTMIDAKAQAEISLQEAREYFEQVFPAWQQLSARERELLELRYVDGCEGSGIRRVMEHFSVEKSAAYNISNEALEHFARLIFW